MGESLEPELVEGLEGVRIGVLREFRKGLKGETGAGGESLESDSEDSML